MVKIGEKFSMAEKCNGLEGSFKLDLVWDSEI